MVPFSIIFVGEFCVTIYSHRDKILPRICHKRRCNLEHYVKLWLYTWRGDIFRLKVNYCILSVLELLSLIGQISDK